MKHVVYLVLAACSYERPADVPNGGGGMDGPPATIDGKSADAKPCNAKTDYEPADLTAQSAQNQTAGTLQHIIWGGTIGNGGEIAVELTSRVPPFETAITPGEYPIDDANSAGMGVELAFEFDQADNPHDYYEADSGTILITAAPGPGMQGQFAGMLKMVHFVHVKTDADGDPTSTVLTDCTSEVGGMTMMATTTP